LSVIELEGGLQITMDAQSASAPELDALFQDVYAELKRSAHGIRGRDQSGAGLHTTQLVHELYLRLRKTSAVSFPSKPQFFGYAARAMRSILIDQARSRQSSQARDQAHFASDALLAPGEAMSADLAISLEAALQALAVLDARAAQVVELHFFLELPLAEIAEQLGVAGRTIDRDWRFARAFLQSEMRRA
jgi:RNA polymerase sigma factor (TIGR02999 family)